MNIPYIDGNEELQYIARNKSIPKMKIGNVLDIYYRYSHKEGNPEKHYKTINQITGISLEQIKEIFRIQLDFLKLKGIVHET